MKEKKCPMCGSMITATPDTIVSYVGTSGEELKNHDVTYTYFCICGAVIKATGEDYK